MDTGTFPGVKYGRGVLLTTHPLLVPWSWKSRAIPLPTLWAATGPVTGTLYLYLYEWEGSSEIRTDRQIDRHDEANSHTLLKWLLYTRNAVSQKPTVPQQVKEFLAFYGAHSFITVFTCSCPEPGHSVQVLPTDLFKKIFNIILPYTSESSKRSLSLKITLQLIHRRKITWTRNSSS